MKNLFTLLAIASFLVGVNAQAVTTEEVFKAASNFGIAKQETLTGLDSKNRKCEIYYGVGPFSFSVSGTVYVTSNGVETADISVYPQDTGHKVTQFVSEGSAQKEGTFKVKLREHVPAHKTDFGLFVPAYDIDSSATLKFSGGRLVRADVQTERPGLSKLVLDPDYRGGKIEGCTFK